MLLELFEFRSARMQKVLFHSVLVCCNQFIAYPHKTTTVFFWTTYITCSIAFYACEPQKTVHRVALF